MTGRHIDRSHRSEVRRDQRLAKKGLDSEDDACKSTTANVNSVTGVLLKDLSDMDERVIIEDSIQRLKELLRRIDNKTRSTEDTCDSTQTITLENTTVCSVTAETTAVTNTSTAVAKVTTAFNVTNKAANITTTKAATTITNASITTTAKTVTTNSKVTTPVVEYLCTSTLAPERPRCRDDPIYELTEFGADIGPGLGDLINVYLNVTNDMVCLSMQ